MPCAIIDYESGNLHSVHKAVLAASIFHDRTTGLSEAKGFLKSQGIVIRDIPGG